MAFHPGNYPLNVNGKDHATFQCAQCKLWYVAEMVAQTRIVHQPAADSVVEHFCKNCVPAVPDEPVVVNSNPDGNRSGSNGPSHPSGELLGYPVVVDPKMPALKAGDIEVQKPGCTKPFSDIVQKPYSFTDQEASKTQPVNPIQMKRDEAIREVIERQTERLHRQRLVQETRLSLEAMFKELRVHSANRLDHAYRWSMTDLVTDMCALVEDPTFIAKWRKMQEEFDRDCKYKAMGLKPDGN